MQNYEDSSSIGSLKEKLKIFGINSKSNNKHYLLKKFQESEKKLIRSQAYIRGWLRRRAYLDLLAQNKSKIPLLVNDTSLIGDDFQSMSEIEFYVLKDNKQYYGFHLPEIWEWSCRQGNKFNPYTNNPLSETTLAQINRLYHKIPIKDTIDEPPTVDYNARLTNFFIQVESMGCYANMEGYKNLTVEQLYDFFKTLYQEYEIVRVAISEEDFDTFVNSFNSATIRETVLTLLEDLFNKSLTRQEKEELALIFTLHLSKSLSPNNDELEHYYLHNLNFLIEHIIQQNRKSVV